MSDDLQTTAKVAKPSDVQFSMRTMLIATAVLAVVFAALGMFIRKFPADVQPRLIHYWLLLVVVLGAVVGYYTRRRYLAEQKAGVALFQFVPHSYFFPRAPRFMTIFIGALLLISGPAMWVMGSFIIATGKASWWQTIRIESIYCVIGSGIGITFLWWHQRVRICEHGYVVRHEFLPWQTCRRSYWDACNRDVIVTEWEKHSRVAVRVPPENREAIELLLRQKTAD